MSDMSMEEFESLLCEKCLAIWNEKNQIGVDDLCADCRATLNIREDEELMKLLRGCGIKVD